MFSVCLFVHVCPCDNSFAFVDFTSIEYATSALTNPKNHHLDGRKLLVEYASPDAVRRGGGNGPRPKKESGGPRNKTLNHPKLSPASSRPRGQRHDANGALIGDDVNEAQLHVNQGDANKKGRSKGKRPIHSADTSSDQQRLRSRPKPGAALALAKRESAAILPGKGQKIKF